MILAANQPYFIPYIGYWQLINKSDIFVISDDFNYIVRGWVNRNRILNNGTFNYLTLPIKNADDRVYISDTYLMDINVEKHLRKIEYIYHKATNFQEGYELIKTILSYPERNLADFLLNSFHKISKYLDINTIFLKSSSFEGNSLLKREHRIYDQCARLGADTYINAIGGMQLYDFEEFKKRGITLKFLKTKPIEYKQFNHPFVPNLSILDVIMFNSREEVIKMLNCYDLIGE